MADLDLIPRCLGYFGAPIAPNDCRNCKTREVCESIIAKDRLRPILQRVEKIATVLKGGRGKSE